MGHTDRVELDHREAEEPVTVEEGFESSPWNEADSDVPPPSIPKPSPDGYPTEWLGPQARRDGEPDPITQEMAGADAPVGADA